MNLLTVPLLEALILIAKMTVIICWGVIMIGFAIRVLLGCIIDEISEYKNRQRNSFQ